MAQPALPAGGDPRSLPIHSLGTPVTITSGTCPRPQQCGCDVRPLPLGNSLRLDLPTGVNDSLGRVGRSGRSRLFD